MISKILDFIEKRVQPKKEEEPMSTLLGVPLTGFNANTGAVTTTIYPTQNAYTQAYNQVLSNYPAGLGAAGGNYGGAGGPQVTTVYGQAYTTYANQTNVGYHAPLPPMSGVLVSIAFTDAGGATYAVTVDQVYVQILQDISRNIQTTYSNQQAAQSPYAGQPHLKMLDGDFSEEEMTEAEGIIAELEGWHGPEAPHP